MLLLNAWIWVVAFASVVTAFWNTCWILFEFTATYLRVLEVLNPTKNNQMTIAIIFTTFFNSYPINTPTKKPLHMVTLIDVMFSTFNRCRLTTYHSNCSGIPLDCRKSKDHVNKQPDIYWIIRQFDKVVFSTRLSQVIVNNKEHEFTKSTDIFINVDVYTPLELTK